MQTQSSLSLLIGSFICISCFLGSCTPKPTASKEAEMPNETLIADTIFYPVKIKNINPDDEWADIRLKKLNRAKLVDDIFQSVYEGKATAYNYLTDAALTIQDIKELEAKPEFSRDNVVELEFREKWWFDANKTVFKKQVLSILVAYVVFEEDGKYRMKAGFYIKMNN
jgi:hypothetical protein